MELCLVHMCLNDISTFQGEETVWKMMNVLGTQGWHTLFQEGRERLENPIEIPWSFACLIDKKFVPPRQTVNTDFYEKVLTKPTVRVRRANANNWRLHHNVPRGGISCPAQCDNGASSSLQTQLGLARLFSIPENKICAPGKESRLGRGG
ncbi:hypothetical protein TNCV_5074221 [Trichonephila clavipes]|nr:hypothetical protein TNCV_5074221 [Trichonephila clavipes]